jgi:hypothetical protein
MFVRVKGKGPIGISRLWKTAARATGVLRVVAGESGGQPLPFAGGGSFPPAVRPIPKNVVPKDKTALITI